MTFKLHDLLLAWCSLGHGLRSQFNHSSKILENEKSSSVLAVENCGQPPVATVQWAFAVLCCCYQVWLQMNTDSNLVIRSSECLSVLFLEAVSLATNSYLHILSDYISYQFFFFKRTFYELFHGSGISHEKHRCCI